MKPLLTAVAAVLISSNATADTIACIKYLQTQYPYPNAQQAASYCGRANVTCIKYIQSQYPYPQAPQAAEACGNGAGVECIKYIQSQYPYPRANDAAESCAVSCP